MRLFTLLAGYAAGIAVAMKYRKDAGTSKLNSETPNTSKLNSFIDEVVDIHKTAFAEVKGFVKDNFDDVDNFDDLQKKVSTMISGFSSDLDTHIEKAKKAGTSKKDELLKIATDLYDSREKILDTAKNKASSFTGIPQDTIDSWINTAKTELSNAYAAIQSKFSESVVSEEEDEEPKKAPTQKSTSKKAPEKAQEKTE